MKTLFSLLCLVAITSLSFGQGGSIGQAIASLDALAKTPADQKLVLSAVAQQTRIPEATLQAQINQTKLGYGDLLVANTIAQTTKQKLDAVIAQKQGKDWSAVASEHKLDSSSILARLKNASKMVQTALKTAAVKPKASATPTAKPKRFRPGHFDSD
jgi:DNA-binding IclR family transcriptional regulator